MWHYITSHYINYIILQHNILPILYYNILNELHYITVRYINDIILYVI